MTKAIKIERLIFSKQLFDQMTALIIQGLPKETVGIIGGSSVGLIKKIYPLTNLGTASYFLADPYEQFQAFKAMKLENHTTLAIYHSHPDGGVHLSQSDMVFLSRFNLVQIVVAVSSKQPHKIKMKAYHIVDYQPLEIPVTVK